MLHLRASVPPPSLLDQPEAHQRSPQRQLGSRSVQIAWTLPQSFLSASSRLLGPGGVDLLNALGGVGEDDDLIGTNLEEPAADKEAHFLPPAANTQLAGHEARHERRVLGKDAQLAFAPRRDHDIHLVGIDLAFGGDDLELQWHGVRPRQARTPAFV
ncbi:MAG: hypothetical protein KatS3mg060_0246 [Dehalococcoidia bacterium]|nr:MAG: hypothetical protein KatS3mg060_0246 [Dehalococcoidia bacterium]